MWPLNSQVVPESEARVNGYIMVVEANIWLSCTIYEDHEFWAGADLLFCLTSLPWIVLVTWVPPKKNPSHLIFDILIKFATWKCHLLNILFFL